MVYNKKANLSGLAFFMEVFLVFLSRVIIQKASAVLRPAG